MADAEEVASHRASFDQDLVAAARLESERLAIRLRPASAVLQPEDIAAIHVGIEADDHPFDLSTGATQEAKAVQERLAGRLASLEALAERERKK